MSRGEYCDVIQGLERASPLGLSGEGARPEWLISALQEERARPWDAEDRPQTVLVPSPHPAPSLRRGAILVQIYPLGPAAGSCFPIEHGSILLGRDGSCDVSGDHPSVSRRHARIERRADGYHVVDLKSTNGTFVNDQREVDSRLEDGDYLRLGGCVYRFLAHENVESRYHEELHRLATLDYLTNVTNQRHFVQVLEREVERAREDDRPLALAILDIDYFKSTNDRLGHLAGDHVLRQLAACVRQTVRKEDIVARYGGEEFAILLPGTDRAGARVVAEAVRTQVERHPFEWEGRTFHITVSLGLGEVRPGEPVTPRDLLRQADDNLYDAKRNGRNRVVGEAVGPRNKDRARQG